MKSIGIVGAGIGALHLGLFLQKHGLEPIIYSDRTPDQIRDGRVPNFVVRFEPTRERERALGVEYWGSSIFGAASGLETYINLDPVLAWTGSLKKLASCIDMRLYQSRLLEDFADRGGKVFVGELQATDVVQLSERHDLVVVAAGRAGIAGMFPRDPKRSPFTQPQRFLTGAYFQGLAPADNLLVTLNISPGNGEVFQQSATTVVGRCSQILFEAVPGGAFEAIAQVRYEDNPRRFETTALNLLREYAPPIYERVNPKEFGVTRPLDVLQGAITPTVRRAYTPLGNGKFAIALGDMHILVDPVLGQGANLASKCAFILGEALLEDRELNELFCHEVAEKFWEAGAAPAEWTNQMLQPPPEHVMNLFFAARDNRAIGDELVDNFSRPERNWEIFETAEGSGAFLQRHGAAMPQAALVA